MSRMKDKKRAKRSSTLRIPGMKDVEGKIRLPEGEYLVKVHEVTEERGPAAPYFKWKLMVAEGPKKGGILYFNTSLAVQALWNLRSLLEALGVDVPDDETEMDTDDFLGKEMMVSVEHESYEGKKQSKIADFWPVGDGERDEEVEDDGEDEGDAEEEKPRGKGRRAEKRRAAKAAKEDDDDEDSEGDDGDEEEKESPKSRRAARRGAEGNGKKSSSKKKSSLTQDEVQDMSADELADVVSEHELEVDLDDLPTLRKQRAAVIDALDDAGLIAE